MALPGIRSTDLLRFSNPFAGPISPPTANSSSIPGQPMQPPKATTAPISQNNPFTNAGGLFGKQNNPMDPFGLTTKAPTPLPMPGTGSGPTAPTGKSPLPMPLQGKGSLFGAPIGQPPAGMPAGAPPAPEIPKNLGAPLSVTPPKQNLTTTGIPTEATVLPAEPSAEEKAYAKQQQDAAKAFADAEKERSKVAAEREKAAELQRKADEQARKAAMASEAARVKAETDAKTKGDAAKQTTIAEPNIPTDATVVTPDQKFQTTLDEFDKIAEEMRDNPGKWLEPYFATAANRMMQSLALTSEAQRMNLQMRINQDPSLRGQGAANAMMSALTRDQNFNMANAWGALTENNQKLLQDVAEKGIDLGLKINAERRNRKIEDADRLIAAGDYPGAAKLIGESIEGFEGALSIDPKALEKRDPYFARNLKSRLDAIIKVAENDPARAAEMLRTEMAANPELFPQGMTPEEAIQTLLTKTPEEVSARVQTLNLDINNVALSPVGSYDEAQPLIEDWFATKGIDPVKRGQSLANNTEALARLNAHRAKSGLSALSIEDGQFVDADGVPLDFEEVAYLDEWLQRDTEADKMSEDKAFERIMGSAFAAKFLEGNVAGQNALKGYLTTVFLDPNATITDPKTGIRTPDMSKLGAYPWDRRELAHLYYQWPVVAKWDAEGKPVGAYTTVTGAYGEIEGGKEIMASPEDQAMDAKWKAYLATDGKLTKDEWYFASAGGTMDPAREGAFVPEGVKAKAAPPGNDLPPVPGETTFDPKTKSLSIGGKTKDLNSLNPADWEKVIANQDLLSQMHDAGVIRMGDVQPAKKLADFEKSGLKADKMRQDVVSDFAFTDDKRYDAGGAGEGKGSIVFHKGKPYRVVEYVATKNVHKLGGDAFWGDIVLKDLITGNTVTVSTR